jgi:hypothetical protein
MAVAEARRTTLRGTVNNVVSVAQRITSPAPFACDYVRGHTERVAKRVTKGLSALDALLKRRRVRLNTLLDKRGTFVPPPDPLEVLRGMTVDEIKQWSRCSNWQADNAPSATKTTTERRGSGNSTKRTGESERAMGSSTTLPSHVVARPRGVTRSATLTRTSGR